jgi:N-acyl-D-aspartate/D-glutamate deacylase
MRILLLASGLLLAQLASAATYDVVLQGGRVIDPETGLDAVRNVGITGGTIMRVTAGPLAGRRVIDAAGLVVAPGFVDLHQHGQSEEDGRIKALDGVTTALETEIGVPDVATFLQQKQGHSLINYGTTASHAAARARAFAAPIAAPLLVPPAGTATDLPATPEQLQRIDGRLRSELDAGALGIGMGIQYTPGASRLEVIETFRLAASRGVPVFTHVRSFGRIEPGSSIEAVSEVIGAAAVTGASLHIAHINSSCLADALECISLVAGARARGLDVTTEAYPYVAGMTDLRSALFNAGWREKVGVGYDALQLPASGERLTEQRFNELRRSPDPVRVLIFVNREEAVDAVIAQPLVMIASDGEASHPRNSGTYSRILSRYVREQGSVTLADAIRKMSLMPAQRLEKSTPAARRKGRVQEGADADLVVFDARTVSDHSTYANPREPSTGMRYVLVGGTVLVDQGRVVPDTFPGQAVRR